MWQRQLIFLHIPKTAGWALHEALLPIFGDAGSLRINNEDEAAQLRRLPAAEFRRYRYVSGHFTFADIKDKCDSDARLVSIVRDPIRRLISEFNYMSTWTEHPYFELCRDMKFSKYMERVGDYPKGLQCSWLSGLGEAEGGLAVIRQKFALVGTAERFDEFVEALGRLIGEPLSAPRANVTQGQGRLDLDSALCRILVDLTAEDRKLVECISALPDGLFAGGCEASPAAEAVQ